MTKHQTKHQINWDDKQIKNIKELIIGQTYMMKHIRDDCGKFKLITIADNKIVIRREYFDFDTEEYLSDLGIIPYETDIWNPVNWVKKI
jgi:hypothetical protein